MALLLDWFEYKIDDTPQQHIFVYCFHLYLDVANLLYIRNWVSFIYMLMAFAAEYSLNAKLWVHVIRIKFYHFWTSDGYVCWYARQPKPKLTSKYTRSTHGKSEFPYRNILTHDYFQPFCRQRTITLLHVIPCIDKHAGILYIISWMTGLEVKLSTDSWYIYIHIYRWGAYKSQVDSFPWYWILN